MFRRATSRSPRFSISRRFDDRRKRLVIEPLEDRRLRAVSSFQDGVFPTPNYDGARDAPVFAAEPEMNFGGESTLRADAVQGATGLAVWSLLK